MILTDFLKDNSVVYVTRDFERALGLPPSDGYHIVSNKSSALNTHSYHALLIAEKEELDTHELLAHAEVIAYINTLKNPHIVVFKNTPQIERVCADNNWQLLNPSAILAAKVEEKISQVEWLGELASFLPPHEITLVKNITWDGIPFVVQFNHGHTGTGTHLIEHESDLTELKNKFPERDVRKTAFIDGPVFTNNNVVTENSVTEGNISFQITGLPPFTEIPFSTIGNDWALPITFLTAEQKNTYSDMVQKIGNKLRESGWKGMFGIDVKVDKKTSHLFLLEINARQPASSTFESILQKNTDQHGLTIFEAHLCALLKLGAAEPITIITDGAQIVQRLTTSYLERKKISEEKITELKNKNLTVTPYANTKPNSDLLRIQSLITIMTDEKTLNELGLFIQHVLS